MDTEDVRPQPTQRWHLEYHLDKTYRLSKEAEDNWLGLICDEGGEEVIDLRPLAVDHYVFARACARHMVLRHNKRFPPKESE